jgi:hypothetical protein
MRNRPDSIFGEDKVGAEVLIEVLAVCDGMLGTENPSRCRAGQRLCGVALLTVDPYSVVI